jgi:uncharacterized protein YaaN involved in tellurite resistance
MTTSNPLPAASTAIVTADQYALSVRKPPALPPLALTELARAQALSTSLVPSEDHLGDIIKFGSEVQAALADISKRMLAGVRGKTLDEVLQLSDGVLGQVRQLNLDELSPMARRTRFLLKESAAAIKQRIARFFKGFELVSRQLDRQEAEIFRKEAEAAQRYHALAELERATRQLMLDARVSAAAIDLFLSSNSGAAELDRRQQRVAAELAAAQSETRSVDFVIVTAAERYAKYLERVEMKRTSLQQAVLAAYQSEITIRMLQDNENIIRQRLSDVRTDLLPQWRTRITLAYNAYVQQGIAQFVKGLQSAEAELRVKTGDQLVQTANSVAELMTRQVFDPAAMQYHQDRLIAALETLKLASTEARRLRDTAEDSMKRSIDELGAAVAATAAPESRDHRG